MTSLRDRIIAAQSGSGVEQRLMPMWTAWRMNNSDHTFSDGAMQMATEVLQRRQRTYKGMRHSPSAGGDCIRQSVISFHGYKQRDNESIVTQHKFDDGNFGHLRWQMYLYDMGVLAAAEVPLAYKPWGVAGTADGVLEVPLEGWDKSMNRAEVRALVESGDVPVWTSLLEIKRMAQYRWQTAKNDKMPEYKILWQGAVYYTAAKHSKYPKIDDVCYWFEGKDVNDVVEFDIKPEERMVAKIDRYYKQSLAHYEAGSLPERPFADGSKTCNWCWFKHHCKRFEEKGRETITPAKGAVMGDFEV